MIKKPFHGKMSLKMNILFTKDLAMTYIILASFLIISIAFSFFIDAIVDKKITKQHENDYEKNSSTHQ